MVRFGFLLFAATIAEDRIALARSWTLSHGNFWRMFAVLLALFLPFLIAVFIGLYALGIFPHFPAGATPADIRALQQAASAAAIARMQHYWYIVYPVSALLNLLVYGLAAGAQSFAYRVLTDADSTPNPP